MTARVVADAGGVYARAVLLAVGPEHGIRKGEIALDERGLVGRVTEVGARTARVLLITDLNSRIPVMLENSRARAIMIGTNGPRPRLALLAGGRAAGRGRARGDERRGQRLPADLPVGTVHYSASKVPRWSRRRIWTGWRWCACSTTACMMRWRNPTRVSRIGGQAALMSRGTEARRC